MDHLNDIADYLNNSTTINDIAITWLEFYWNGIVKTNLWGTTYSTLLVSFKRLCKDLTEIPAKNFLTTDQVTYLVTKDIYEKLKPDECLLQFLEWSIKAFSSEIEKLIATALPKFVKSFNT